MQAVIQAPFLGARTGVVLCLASMFVFAVQDAISKVLVQDMPIAQVIMVRYWAFLVFALLYVRLKGGGSQAMRSTHPWLQLLRSLLAVGEIALFNLALRYMGLAEAHALLAVFPLLVIALAGPFLGEEVGLRRWVAVGIGFIGTLVILQPGFGVFKPESLIALASAFAFAVYNLVTRRVSRDDGFATSMFYMAAVGCIASTLFGLQAWQAPSAVEWGMLAVLSVTGISAHLLLVKSLEYAPAALLQPFNYSLLVFATLIGMLVFAEFPDPGTIIGALLVIMGGLYAIVPGRLWR